ncbi:MAG: SMI1/KNR4 family protein [Myxococcota bacterium]
MISHEKLRKTKSIDISTKTLTSFPPYRGTDEKLVEYILKKIFRSLKSIRRVLGFHRRVRGKSVLRLLSYHDGGGIAVCDASGPANFNKTCAKIARSCGDDFFHFDFEFLEGITQRGSVGASGFFKSYPTSWEDLDSRLAKFALQLAPRDFDPVKLKKDQERDAKKKKKIFRDYKEIPERDDEVDIDQLNDDVRALLGRRKSKGATSAQLDNLATLIGTELPPEFRRLYEIANGAKGALFNHDLLSLKDVTREWKMWKSIYDEWTSDDLRCVSGQRGVVFAAYFCPRWVPFVDLVGGNFLAVDLAPNKKGRLGQVIVFGGDVQHIRRVALDLGDFFQQCARGLDELKRLSDVKR